MAGHIGEYFSSLGIKNTYGCSPETLQKKIKSDTFPYHFKYT